MAHKWFNFSEFSSAQMITYCCYRYSDQDIRNFQHSGSTPCPPVIMPQSNHSPDFCHMGGFAYSCSFSMGPERLHCFTSLASLPLPIVFHLPPGPLGTRGWDFYSKGGHSKSPGYGKMDSACSVLEGTDMDSSHWLSAHQMPWYWWPENDGAREGSGTITWP